VSLLLDSIPYQSQDAAKQACARTKVVGHFRRRDMIYYTEQAVKDLVQGYDFVLFNQFAWWRIVAGYLGPAIWGRLFGAGFLGPAFWGRAMTTWRSKVVTEPLLQRRQHQHQ
jgi:hypothetical protein